MVLLLRKSSIQAVSQPLIPREERRKFKMESWSALSKALCISKKAEYTVKEALCYCVCCITSWK